MTDEDRIAISLWCALAPIWFEHVVVLGRTCSDAGCARVACWTTFWPGQTAVKCTAHRDGWAKIALVMGFELVSQPLAVAEHPVDDPTAKRFSLLELA